MSDANWDYATQNKARRQLFTLRDVCPREWHKDAPWAARRPDQVHDSTSQPEYMQGVQSEFRRAVSVEGCDCPALALVTLFWNRVCDTLAYSKKFLLLRKNTRCSSRLSRFAPLECHCIAPDGFPTCGPISPQLVPITP